MKVISKLSILRRSDARPGLHNTVAAIGIFDGVHRGHQLLLGRMLRQAKLLRAQSMAITFFPHPVHVLRPDLDLRYVVSLPHRLQLLEQLGVDVCLVLPFTKAVASVEPELFVDFLVRRCGARALFVGEDFRFGRERRGDIGLLKRMAKSCGYQMHAVRALTDTHGPISSSRIRRMVLDGDLASARRLLGRPFSVLGTVVKGRGLGKKLGYPTANVAYDNAILPPDGVYAVRIVLGDGEYPAAANLGIRPSLQQKLTKSLLEIHVFDFHRNIYGQPIEVKFIKYVRPERRFVDTDALSKQIGIDVRNIQRLLRSP